MEWSLSPAPCPAWSLLLPWLTPALGVRALPKGEEATVASGPRLAGCT